MRPLSRSAPRRAPWRRSARASTATDVLVVCTANICRSPYVAARLRSLLPDTAVTSAGTYALVGEPPTPPVLDELQRRGLRYEGTARPLTAPMIRGARLVLTATGAQRSEVIALDPAAAGYTFTIKEFARTDGVVRHDVRDHDDDLDDPFGGGDADYARMFAEADRAIATIVAVIKAGRPA